MSDTWNDIQALKSRTLSLREKHLRRKRELEAIKAGITDPSKDGAQGQTSNTGAATSQTTEKITCTKTDQSESVKLEPEFLSLVEKQLLVQLSDVGLNLPVDAPTLTSTVSKALDREVPLGILENLLQKLVAQQLLSVKSKEAERVGMPNTLSIVFISHKKLSAVSGLHESDEAPAKKRKTDQEEEGKEQEKSPVETEAKKEFSVESLLSTHSAKEKENKKVNEEILELLSAPTAKEQTLLEKFKSQGGAQLQEFCQFGTKEECRKVQGNKCDKLHFKKIINKHTDESLGDCSFLNTCFHMDSCKYVHYEIAYPEGYSKVRADIQIKKPRANEKDETTVLFPQQWVQCDLRHFDMSVLGKFAIIMADPPWDIHMELPYGTMSDDEMRRLDVPSLQDDGYIFLWVTGRAMELGRECLKLWGYDRVDELIWVKTNQLQRIIRTGRTGHWLNHGKEHCLVGAKGNPKNMNNGMDCDVIVAEVRATSHKPDEVYGIIERLSPGTRKIELFGRPHNVQPNWVTLGNQLDGVKLLDPEVVKAFKKRYPDGNCLKPQQQPQQQ